MSKEFSKAFILYKAQNSGKGAASQWSISSSKDCVFLEMAKQIGKNDDNNPKFDWQNKVSFKLGSADIGEILAVLCGLQTSVGPMDTTTKKHKGLFHVNQNGNSILHFGKDGQDRLNIYLSAKKGKDQTIIKHTITKGESCILETILKQAISIIYKWN